MRRKELVLLPVTVPQIADFPVSKFKNKTVLRGQVYRCLLGPNAHASPRKHSLKWENIALNGDLTLGFFDRSITQAMDTQRAQIIYAKRAEVKP